MYDLEHLLVARSALLADSPAGSHHAQRPVSKLMRGLRRQVTDAAGGVRCAMVVVDLAMAEWWMTSAMVRSVRQAHGMTALSVGIGQELLVNLHHAVADHLAEVQPAMKRVRLTRSIT